LGLGEGGDGGVSSTSFQRSFVSYPRATSSTSIRVSSRRCLFRTS
jgi:hypothetical protein